MKNAWMPVAAAIQVVEAQSNSACLQCGCVGKGGKSVVRRSHDRADDEEEGSG